MATVLAQRFPLLHSIHSIQSRSLPERRTVYLGKANWKDPERRNAIQDGTNVKMEWRIETAFLILSCWIAIPPAKIPLHDAWLELEKLVNDRNMAFWEGERTSPGCSWDRAMHGKSINDAQPTIIFNSVSKICRRNAKMIIADRGIVVDHRGIGLEFYAHGPQFFSGHPILGSSENAIGDHPSSSKASVPIHRHTSISAASDCFPMLPLQPTRAVVSGLLVSVGSQECTLGGVIMINGIMLGLTVAHVFETEKAKEGLGTPTAICYTGIGDIGLIQHRRDSPKPGEACQRNFDWAVCSLDDKTTKATNSVKVSSDQSILVCDIFQVDPVDSAVIVNTGRTGIVYGHIIGDYSLVSLPGSKLFQKMWIVLMERNIEDGDCGSWVIDRRTRELYGHIVAGKPDSKVAYLLLAKEIFRDIAEQLGGAEVQLPSERSFILQRLSSIKENIRTPAETPGSFSITTLLTSQVPLISGPFPTSVPLGSAQYAHFKQQRLPATSAGKWKPGYARTWFVVLTTLSIIFIEVQVSLLLGTWEASAFSMVATLLGGVLWQMLYLNVRYTEPYYALAATNGSDAVISSDLLDLYRIYRFFKPSSSSGNIAIFYSMQGTIIAELVLPLLYLCFPSDNANGRQIIIFTIIICLLYNYLVAINLLRYRNRHTGLTTHPGGLIGKMLLLVNPLWSNKQERISNCSSLIDDYRIAIPNSTYQFIWHGNSWAQHETRHRLLPPPNTNVSDASPEFIEQLLPEDPETSQEHTTGQIPSKGICFFEGDYTLRHGKILYKPVSHPTYFVGRSDRSNRSSRIPLRKFNGAFLSLLFVLVYNLILESMNPILLHILSENRRQTNLPTYVLRILFAFVVKILWMPMEEDLREREPFRILCKGNAPTSTLFLDYTTTAPGLLVIQALRNGHYVLGAAAAGSLLIDLNLLCLYLSLELSSVFNAILLAIAFFVYREKRDSNLPHGPYSLPQIFTYLYHSPLAYYCLKMEGKDRKAMEKKMEESSTTWAMGWYVDDGGNRRYGIYKEEKLNDV